MESTHGAGCRYHTRCHGVISSIRNSWSVFPKLGWLCHLTQLPVPSVVGGVRTGWSPLLAHPGLPAPCANGVDPTIPKPCIQTITCIPNFKLSPGEEQSLSAKSQQLRELQSCRGDYLLLPQGKEWKSKCNLHPELSEGNTIGCSGCP